MKKLIVLFVFMWISSVASAQYYSPNVMMDPCVQAAIQAAQSSQWVMQNNQMIMQQQAQMMNNGWYPAPAQYNNNSSNQNSSSRSPKKCGACGGKGWVPDTSGPSFGNEKWCSECERRVPASHYHKTCPSCKGNGYW